MNETRRPIRILRLEKEGANALSVRHSLRCLACDFWQLGQALAGHWRRYGRIFAQGWMYKNRWWTWQDRQN
jgi:hypothetical protein